MYIDPIRYSGRPADGSGRIPQELAIYDRLDQLSIPFDRVDHEHADTMEICQEVEKVLGGQICKNLFLCNRQQTQFYLLMMPGDKPFKTKHLSAQLGCARLSFATPEQMKQLLGAAPGSASAFELMHDKEGKVQLVIDRELLEGESISGHPCFSTSTLRLKRTDFLDRFLPAVGHQPVFVDLPWPEQE